MDPVCSLLIKTEEEHGKDIFLFHPGADQPWVELRGALQFNKFRFFPTHASAGNAFPQLQMLVEPQTENVIQEKAKDEAEDDDEGGPDDPTEHLNRQLKQIRRGGRIDRLKIESK
jgi:hypothetical protein